MNAETRKLELIAWIYSLSSEELLSKIEFLKKSDQDWWVSLPDDVKQKVLASEKEFDDSSGIEHDVQIDKLNKLM